MQIRERAKDLYEGRRIYNYRRRAEPARADTEYLQAVDDLILCKMPIVKNVVVEINP